MEEVIELDPIEAEVEAIRLKIYEHVKDMTPKEFGDYIKRRTDPLIKQFNIKVVNPPIIRRTRHPLEDFEESLRKN